MEFVRNPRKIIRVPEGLYDFTDEEIEYLHRCREGENGDFGKSGGRSSHFQGPTTQAFRNDFRRLRESFRSIAQFGSRRDHLMDETKSYNHEFSYSHNSPAIETSSSDSEDDFKYPEKENSRLEGNVHMPNGACSPVAKVSSFGAECQGRLGPQPTTSRSRRKLLIVPEPEICDPNHLGIFEDSGEGGFDDSLGEQSNQTNVPITKKIASFGRLILSTMTPDPL